MLHLLLASAARTPNEVDLKSPLKLCYVPLPWRCHIRGLSRGCHHNLRGPCYRILRAETPHTLTPAKRLDVPYLVFARSKTEVCVCMCTLTAGRKSRRRLPLRRNRCVSMTAVSARWSSLAALGKFDSSGLLVHFLCSCCGRHCAAADVGSSICIWAGWGSRLTLWREADGLGTDLHYE